MKIRFKHIGLILGLISIILSFLFFAREHDTYTMFLIGGLFFSLVFFLIIVFGKESWKVKLFWTLIVVFAIFINWLTEPSLRKQSYLIYISSNEKELNEVNEILKNKSGDIYIQNNDITQGDSLLSQNEKVRLKELRKDLKVYTISKSKRGIYYGLWGFLDIRLGITYLTIDRKETNLNYQQLEGNWYH